jgi:hypothetical protein
MRFTPSTAGFARSGYAGSDFPRTSPTCPQIKHRTVIMRVPAPAQDIEASRAQNLSDAARIALLPRRTVRQGLKRLQERARSIRACFDAFSAADQVYRNRYELNCNASDAQPIAIGKSGTPPLPIACSTRWRDGHRRPFAERDDPRKF